jgi:tetratricopeptide (TPR) repeat protein
MGTINKISNSFFITFLLLLFATIAYGQKERKFIREGNKHYEKATADTAKIDTVRYQMAVTAYRKALDKKPGDFKAQFNLGAAQFKQQKMPEATTQFEQAIAAAQNKDERSRSYFNQGNAYLAQNKLDESIEAYKNALRNNPNDLEAKYNLEFARRMKQQQEQNKDQNKDQNDQKQDQQQNENQDQKQDQNNDQNQQNQNQDQQKQQQPKISSQSAEQMLKALDNDEKKTQEKVNKARAEQVKTNRPDKEW